MEIAYAFLAKAVEASPDGGFHVLGMDFNRILGSYPLYVPVLSVVVKMAFEADECGRLHHVSAHLIAPDGAELEPRLEKDFMPIPVGPGVGATVALVLALQGLVLTATGKYNFRLLFDGEERTKLPFVVETIPLTAPDGQGGTS